MATENELLTVLSGHIGRDNGARVEVLATTLKVTERRVREFVSQLREQGYAVCGHPTTGYYMASKSSEIEETCQFLRARAMHSLHLEAKMRKISLPDLIGQMKLNT